MKRCLVSFCRYILSVCLSDARVPQDHQLSLGDGNVRTRSAWRLRPSIVIKDAKIIMEQMKFE